MKKIIGGVLAACCLWIGQPAYGQDLTQWLAQLRQEAYRKGIPYSVFDRAFEFFEPIERVIELDQKQPESTLTFDEYVANVLPESRIETARELLATHQRLLQRVSREYGVPPEFIVALWGVESNFGQNMGNFSVIDALATLAYDGRRSEFFRAELMHALKILKEGHIPLEEMIGSWAGAMGQCQFMPSSFNRFAVDYDGDRRRDIWDTHADVFASIANYLSKSGWQDDQIWGVEVSLPSDFDTSLADTAIVLPLNEWRKLGVKQINGQPLPPSREDASLVLPDGDEDSSAYLVSSNYRTLMKWNRSTYFATSVGLFADEIAQ